MVIVCSVIQRRIPASRCCSVCFYAYIYTYVIVILTPGQSHLIGILFRFLLIKAGAEAEIRINRLAAVISMLVKDNLK